MWTKILSALVMTVVVKYVAMAGSSPENLKVYEEHDKSSLVFVFDTTGSMYNDLRQLREGAEMILNTALEESNIISDFVFVPFHDPTVGPATVTKDKEVFKSTLGVLRVHGGGDCPEKSLGGINLALNVSKPRSFIYVFTDATASDYRLVGKVLDAVQRKQSQVVFVLTGHCNDLHKPNFKVYQQIAAASSGQVFNLNKTSVHKVLDFVRTSIKARTVNLGSLVNPAGYNYTRGIPIDNSLSEVTVSVSGSKPQIKVVNPSGEELTGPPKLVTTLDLSEIIIVKVLQPEPGNWTITVGSEEEYSVKVVGLSNLTFNHGFSVEKPRSMLETSYRPMQGTYNHMMISLTQADRPVRITRAEILNLEGKTLFEVPLKEVDEENHVYLADPFVPPDDFFYVAIDGYDENNQELRRVGPTAVQAKSPDVPYLTVPHTVEARSHERVHLRCNIESLVPVTAMWTKDSMKIQNQISSLQSTSVEYVINDMTEGDVGSYKCVAKNVAGISRAATEVVLLVDPPQVSISPDNITVLIDEEVTISCTAHSEALLFKFQLVINGTERRYLTNINTEPNVDGYYTYNKTIRARERDSGVYSCIASNKAGMVTKSTYISVQAYPTAQMLGPHTLVKHAHADVQLMCVVENADRMMWIAPNDTVVKRHKLNGSRSDVLDLKDVVDDGVWTCVATMGTRRVADFVQLNVLTKPQVWIEGPKNITVPYNTSHELICNVVAKPEPRIIWHRETERFLNNNITLISPNTYRSVLTLTGKEMIKLTYFCFGENSEGIAQDSVTVNVRRNMRLIEGLADKSVEFYSQIDLHCKIDSYPAPRVTWYHNDTLLVSNENIHISEDGSTVLVQRIDFDDLGMYVCVAENNYEKIVSNGSLTVHGLEKPLISKEPVRRITQRGKATLITCRLLKGNPEPRITWQYKTNASKNFADLPQGVVPNDDPLELMISSARVDHSGKYRCVAENVIGRDIHEVELVVQYPPHFVSSELKENQTENKSLTVKAGKRVSLSCEAVGIPPPMVVWTKDSQPVVYSRNVHLTDENDVVIENATVYDSGLFTCNATSALGSLQRNFTLVVYVTPKIETPRSEPQVEVVEGQLVELPCKVEGSPRPQVLWLHNNHDIDDRRKYIDDFGLRFVANLTDFGEYKCIAGNQFGNTTLTYSVYIWVAPYIEPPLETFKDTLAGANVELNCDAVGFPIPTIFWELHFENSSNIRFDKFGNVLIHNTSTSNEGLYICIAENIAGVARKFIYLNVNEHPKILEDNYTGPYIATNIDSALAIACKAEGNPKPFVAWIKDGLYLDRDSRYEIDIDGTLTIKKPSEELSGLYVCAAMNSVGTANRSIPVEIYSLPTQMQADDNHMQTTVLEGANVDIYCPILTSDSDKVKWYKDAKLISEGTLKIANMSREYNAVYACVVTNAVGSAYSSMRINLEWPPTFVENATENVELVRGEDFWFNCKVDAKPNAKTKWYYNSKLLLGEDKDRLRLMNVQLRHIGTYKCVVSNKHGTVNRKFFLDILEPPFISEFDVLDVQLKEGVNATLECNAKGSPLPTVQWLYNNTNWRVSNQSLIAANITRQSEGLFRCNAVNKAGSAHIVYRVSVVSTSRVTEITLFSNGTATSVDKFVEVVTGSHVRLSCQVNGNPIPLIQWIRNGNILNENNDDISYADLVLDDVKSTQAGVYMCIASNIGGVGEKKVKIDVLEPPKIFQTLFENTNSTTNEVTLEVLSGQAFYLHCHPYGNPMPQVYWFKDGLPLRLFDTTMVSTDFGEIIVANKAMYEQSGNYTCVARNKVGVASIIYLVDVLVPPSTPKESSKSLNLRAGKSLNLTCPAEGSPLPYVNWIKHPYTEISNETPRVQLLYDNITLLINNTEPSDSGKYSCVMTNKVGSMEFIFDVTIEKAPTIAGNVGKNITETHLVPLRRSIVLKCEADGHPIPKISWLKDTQQLSDSASNIQRVLGNSLLAVWSMEVRDSGQYICVVENNAGTAHRRYNLVVKGKWSEWSQWSLCNATCGLGYQLRSRVCHYVDDYNNTIDRNTKSEKMVLDESACRGPLTDRRKCHMPPCEEEGKQPRWSTWSKWSSCSVTCGAGTQARVRRCKTTAPCRGDNVQLRKCPNLPRCDTEPRPSDNEVFASGETLSESNPYIPEVTFELQPEVVNPRKTSDVEEFQVPSTKQIGTQYPTVYHDVNVTENLDRSERGDCDPGFSHNATTSKCDDIDECLIENNQCHSTQVCINMLGGYRCTCDTGFISLSAGERCLDINECEQEISWCEFACVNVAGGYVCACPPPLRLHLDRHHCVPASLYRKPMPYEEADIEDYLSAAVQYPSRYMRTRN